MTSLNGLMAWPAARNGGQDFLDRLTKGVNLATGIGPAHRTAVGSQGARPAHAPDAAAPAGAGDRLEELPRRAEERGLQIRQLIYNLNRALPIVGGRPVLKVDVVLRGMPGPVSGLTGRAVTSAKRALIW